LQVPAGEKVLQGKKLLVDLLKIPINRLIGAKQLYNVNVETVCVLVCSSCQVQLNLSCILYVRFWHYVWYQVGSYQLLQQQKKLMANPQCPPSEVGLYCSMFSLAGALASILRLLQTHGMHCALQKAQEFEDKAQEYYPQPLSLATNYILLQRVKSRRETVSRPEWQQLKQLMQENTKRPQDSHPKLRRVDELVREHFGKRR
jgi:hypothetical protein